MEGLWTIRWQPFTASSPGGYKVGGSEPWPGEDPTPVVPCDDAAVERAALALYEDERGEELPPGFALPPRFRATAATVLRAAGDAPA